MAERGMQSPSVRIAEPYASLQEVLPLNLHGWFGEDNQRGIAALMDRIKPRVVVEVGSWLGQSSAFIARHLPEGGHLYCVDTWQGSEEHYTRSEWAALLPTLYEQFLSNMIHLELTERVTPIRSLSLVAARGWEDSVDLAFIDGDHSTQAVAADCKAWWSHVRPGGVMCGDDMADESVGRGVYRFCRSRALVPYIDGRFWHVEKAA